MKKTIMLALLAIPAFSAIAFDKLSENQMQSLRGAQACHSACTKAAACTEQNCTFVGMEETSVLGIPKKIWYFIKYVKQRDSRLVCDKSATPSTPPCVNDKEVVCTKGYDYAVVTGGSASQPSNGCSGTGNPADQKVKTCER